jgi:GTP diphosphokinase / guanosine-3',5'-bis(diphosphate) 3'-diphosphatase
MNLLEQAVEFAVKAHAGQIDEDGTPHIIHCFEVFRRVQDMFSDYLPLRVLFAPPKLKKYTQEEILIAAVLHDTVEDTSTTLDQIEELFGKNIRDIVDSVSRRVESDGSKEFYRDFIYRAQENEGGLIVKIADLAHNLSRTPKIKKASWRNKLEFKYRTALSVLNDSHEPTWEQASGTVQYEDGTPHCFIADPNGKKIEVTEEEYKTLTKRS